MSAGSTQDPTDRPFQPVPAAAVALAFVLAAIIRLRGLHDYYLSSDDVLHLIIASRDTLAQVWRESLAQFHPPSIYLLLHLLAKISRHDLFLRLVSLVPGLLTIPVLYRLGRRTLGEIGAAAMAFIAAFAFCPVIMSQVVRAYALLMLFEALALTALADYFESGERRRLRLYSLALGLAVCFHYSAALVGASAGAVWLIRSGRVRSLRREWRALVLANLVPALLMAGFLAAHIRNIYVHGYFHEVRELYWPELFPSNLAGFGQSALGLGDYLFWPGGGKFIIVPLLIGTWFLVKKSRFEFAALFWLMLAVNIVLAAGKRYPFGGSRHEAYLFVPAALLCGAAVQAVWEAVRTRAASVRARAAALAIAALAVGLIFWAVEFQRQGFRPEAREEFIVLRADYDRVMTALWEKIGPDDVAVVLNFQTYVYFKDLDPGLAGSALDEHLRAVTLTGPGGKYRGYVFTWWELFGPEPITGLLREMRASLPYHGDRRVWFIQIGKTRTARFLDQALPREDLVEEILTPSAILAGYDQRVIYGPAAAPPAP